LPSECCTFRSEVIRCIYYKFCQELQFCLSENVILSGMLHHCCAHLFTEVYIRGKTSTPPPNRTVLETLATTEMGSGGVIRCVRSRGVITLSPDSLDCLVVCWVI